MLPAVKPPLIRLGNLFPNREVYAKCEFVGASGSFKIRGAVHLLERLTRAATTRLLIVPSMGNTALGAAVGAKEYGFRMVGVVPQAISRAKDEKLQALGVELVKIAGGGSELLHRATEVAQERGGYFVHPHLDPRWTDGYQAIADEILDERPGCRSLVLPLGGGGLLMGMTAALERRPTRPRVFACEAYNYPTYATFSHPRTRTIADGLVLDTPHPAVQERIARHGVDVPLVQDDEIRAALRGLFREHGLVVEPSSAVGVAYALAHGKELEEPICIVLTGQNIAAEDFAALVAARFQRAV